MTSKSIVISAYASHDHNYSEYYTLDNIVIEYINDYVYLYNNV